MALRCWEDYVETVALMTPGDATIDPAGRRERTGPVDLDLAGDHHRRVARCGTPQGYDQHRRYGEPICDDCRAAASRIARRRRAQRARGTAA